MKLADQVIVVTGGGNGIGRAMCRRFAREGPKGIVVADLDGDAAAAVADEIGGTGVEVDVSKEADVVHTVTTAEATYGPVDLYCANAGIAVGGGVEVADDEWQRSWDVNVMAHVWAARAVLPSMLERGQGYLLHTASAAGLLTNIGAGPYSVTKHAVVGLAEWLAISHGDQGLRVSCLCPMGVRTDMLTADTDGEAAAVVLAQGAIEPEAVADAVVDGLADERFLILPHPEVADFERQRATDRGRWLAGMRRLRATVRASL